MGCFILQFRMPSPTADYPIRPVPFTAAQDSSFAFHSDQHVVNHCELDPIPRRLHV